MTMTPKTLHPCAPNPADGGGWIITRVGKGIESSDGEIRRKGNVYGYGWTRKTIRRHPTCVEFRLYDDDDNFCYGGWATDLPAPKNFWWHDECLYELLQWAMNDVGATKLYVRKPGAKEWGNPVY